MSLRATEDMLRVGECSLAGRVQAALRFPVAGEIGRPVAGLVLRTTIGEDRVDGRKLVAALVAVGVTALGVARGTVAVAQAQEPNCSVWLVESSRFMNVPFGAFMPDRAFVPGSTSRDEQHQVRSTCRSTSASSSAATS